MAASMDAGDTVFSGSIPTLYDRHLGPLLFHPFAEEIARRARSLEPRRVLETAARTGIVTACLHEALPAADIVATDLNPAMLEVAAQNILSPRVSMQFADALDLPFADDSFDLVVCQFGVMFYPDKVRGHSEARRVLRKGGRYLLAIWDRLDRNPVSRAVDEAIAALFPDDPPRFLARVPFGYADPAAIQRDLLEAGFAEVKLETIEARNRPISLDEAAAGLTQGSPLRNEIEQRGADALPRATAAAARALGPFEGPRGIDAPMSAHLVTAIA